MRISAVQRSLPSVPVDVRPTVQLSFGSVSTFQPPLPSPSSTACTPA